MSRSHRLLLVLACTVFSSFPALGRAQAYDAAQLEPLLAPVALYPDAVLDDVLIASTVPAEVAAAAQWCGANPGMAPADAQNAVQAYPWQPAVKALVAYPQLLQQMAQSPQWMADLARVYLTQPGDLAQTVQVLRERANSGGSGGGAGGSPYAYGSGYAYGEPYAVLSPGPAIALLPPPIFVTNVVVAGNGRRSPAVRQQALQSRSFVERSRMQNRPSPAVRMQQREQVSVKPYHRVPESRRQAIVRSTGAVFSPRGSVTRPQNPAINRRIAGPSSRPQGASHRPPARR